MSYEHLLPPEKPRNRPATVATDLDCYPDLSSGIKNATTRLFGVLGVAEIAIGAVTLNPVICLHGVLLVCFGPRWLGKGS